jgi:hypothetical protein
MSYPTRVSLSLVLLAALLAGVALAQSPKVTTQSTVGPPVPLSPEQTRAIAEKLAHTQTARPNVPVPSKVVAIDGTPANLVTDLARSRGAQANLPGAPPPPRRWPTVTSRLGPVPRPAWSVPWYDRKPADVTIARPAPPGHLEKNTVPAQRSSGGRP